MSKQALAEAAFLAGVKSVLGGEVSDHWLRDFNVWYAHRDPVPVAKHPVGIPDTHTTQSVTNDCGPEGGDLLESRDCVGAAYTKKQTVREFGTFDAGGTEHRFTKPNLMRVTPDDLYGDDWISERDE